MSGSYPSFKKITIRVLEIAGAGLTSALVAYALGRTETPPPPQGPAIVHLAPSDEEMIRSVRTDQAALLDQLRNADPRKAPPSVAAQPAPASTAEVKPVAPAATDVAVSATDLLPLTAPIKRVKSPQPAATPAPIQVAAPPAPTAPAVTASAATTVAATTPAPTPPATTPTAATPTAAMPVAAPSASPQTVVRREHKPEIKPEAKPRVAAKTEPRAEELLQPRAATPGAGQREVVAAPTTQQPASAAQTPAPEPEYGLTAALKGFGSRLLPSRDRVPVPDQSAVRPPMPVGDLQQSAMSNGSRGGS